MVTWKVRNLLPVMSRLLGNKVLITALTALELALLSYSHPQCAISPEIILIIGGFLEELALRAASWRNCHKKSLFCGWNHSIRISLAHFVALYCVQTHLNRCNRFLSTSINRLSSSHLSQQVRRVDKLTSIWFQLLIYSFYRGQEMSKYATFHFCPKINSGADSV